jgi:hypothetical protein
VLNLVFLGDISGNYASLSAKAFNFRRDCSKLLVFGGNIIESYIEAIFCQAEGNAPTNALSGTSNESNTLWYEHVDEELRLAQFIANEGRATT